MLVDIIVWAVLGLIAGAIARAIYPGHQGLGILGTMVLGIIGAIVGGFIASLIFPAAAAGGSVLSIPGVIIAVIGALITLFIYYAVTKRTA